MMRRPWFNYSQEYIPHAYLELCIPMTENGEVSSRLYYYLITHKLIGTPIFSLPCLKTTCTFGLEDNLWWLDYQIKTNRLPWPFSCLKWCKILIYFLLNNTLDPNLFLDLMASPMATIWFNFLRSISLTPSHWLAKKNWLKITSIPSLYLWFPSNVHLIMYLTNVWFWGMRHTPWYLSMVKEWIV